MKCEYRRLLAFVKCSMYVGDGSKLKRRNDCWPVAAAQIARNWDTRKKRNMTVKERSENRSFLCTLRVYNTCT